MQYSVRQKNRTPTILSAMVAKDLQRKKPVGIERQTKRHRDTQIDRNRDMERQKETRRDRQERETEKDMRDRERDRQRD